MKDAYRKALAWLYGTQNRGVKLGLDNIRYLLAKMDDPHHRLRFLHVAGTNGKGSVCAMLDSICRAGGLRSGLFTSPHLVRFNERIRVQGEPMQDDEVARGIERIRQLIEHQRHPTFFEITTALALEHFLRERVDIVILETGLGGRLDATNVVTPMVSILTAIDLDHQKWLGNSLGEIAKEKAGIIKFKVPVVSGPQFSEVHAAIDAVAIREQTRIRYVEKPLQDIPIPFPGRHQKINAAIAVAALEEAVLPFDLSAIKQGLQCTLWPGRFHEIEPDLILDGAHNPSASRQLVETWKECRGGIKPTIIFGALRDKDLSGMLAALKPIAREFFVVPVRNQRAASTGEINALLPAGIPGASFDSVSDALGAARRVPRPVLVTGSLFLVGEILALLQPGKGGFQSSLQ
ncbi:MAG: folylpolyglutamate synthase/dihydrofolate synthase family protein [Chthoniobacterales bacterium]